MNEARNPLRSTSSKDVLGRVYEYFLSLFASAEGKKGGQFYTSRPATSPRVHW